MSINEFLKNIEIACLISDYSKLNKDSRKKKKKHKQGFTICHLN